MPWDSNPHGLPHASVGNFKRDPKSRILRSRVYSPSFLSSGPPLVGCFAIKGHGSCRQPSPYCSLLGAQVTSPHVPGACIIPCSFSLADTFVRRLLIKVSSTLPILSFQDNTDTMTYNDTHTFYIQYICKYTSMHITGKVS